jgi:hypothetical protein
LFGQDLFSLCGLVSIQKSERQTALAAELERSKIPEPPAIRNLRVRLDPYPELLQIFQRNFAIVEALQ